MAQCFLGYVDPAAPSAENGEITEDFGVYEELRMGLEQIYNTQALSLNSRGDLCVEGTAFLKKSSLDAVMFLEGSAKRYRSRDCCSLTRSYMD